MATYFAFDMAFFVEQQKSVGQNGIVHLPGAQFASIFLFRNHLHLYIALVSNPVCFQLVEFLYQSVFSIEMSPRLSLCSYQFLQLV